MYTVDYFINKFSKIPDELWTVCQLHNDRTGQSCAMGHCNVRHPELLTEEGEELGKLFLSLPFITKRLEGYDNKINKKYMVTYWINDGNIKEYSHLTPKGRILAALKDIKELQQSTIETRTIIKYVAVDAPIRQETKQLQLN